MKESQLLKKWLNGNLMEEELNNIKKSEDYNLNIKILKYIKYFKAPSYSIFENYNALKNSLRNKFKTNNNQI